MAIMAAVQVKTSRPWRPNVAEVLAVLLVTAALGGSYASSFVWLVQQWSHDPNHSYGYCVIPIALVILWNRRCLLDHGRLAPRWWGMLPLLALLGLRVLLYERNEQYIETALIPLVLAAIALALGGWHLVEVAWPAIVFLFLMLPLPPRLNSFMANPLQRLATIGGVDLLQVLGMPVLAEGNVIIVGGDELEVARACNGLSMLLSFITLIMATVLLVRRPLWERVVLLASAVPIALVSNILRITATAWCYHRFGRETGERFTHDAAGWAMMPLALCLVYLELHVLSWLFVDVEEVRAPVYRLVQASRGRRS
jgi:exosortase